MWDKNTFFAEINEKFGRKNDNLQSQIDWLMKYRLPKSLQQKNKKNDEKNNDRPSAKWQKKAKLKGKKSVYHTNDEFEYKSMLKPNSKDDKSDFNETDEKGARVCSNFI